MKTWFVSSGSMRKVRIRANTPSEAFLVAVILSEPKTLSSVAMIFEEGFEDDDNRTHVVPTSILTREVQGDTQVRYAHS